MNGASARTVETRVLVLAPTGRDAELIESVLDKAGFAVSTGSACASGREEASHVLNAMGYSEAESSRALRFSSGWETPREDWQSLLKGLEAVYAEVAAPARL